MLSILQIAWKEIRENLRWMLLAMLAFSLVLVLVILLDVRKDYFYLLSVREKIRYANRSLLTDTVQWITVFGGAVIGLIFGVLLSFFDSRQKQWMAHVHYPISRSKDFWGRTLAGLILLLTATILPYLAVAKWISIPGLIAAPFDWRMVLPGISDFVNGIVYVFAGMLMVLYPSRGWISLFLAFFSSHTVMNGAYEFFDGILITLALGAIMGTAAWGAWLRHGDVYQQPVAAKSAYIVVLLVGIFSVVYFIGNLFSHESEGVGWFNTRYMITRDGELCQVTREGTDWFKNVKDMQGKTLKKNADDERFEIHDFQISGWLFANKGTGGSRRSYRHVNRYYASLIAQSMTDLVWYFVHRERRLVGYSKFDNKPVGVLGPHGYTPLDDNQDNQFVSGLNMDHTAGHDYFFEFHDAIYYIDVADKKVIPICPYPTKNIVDLCEIYNESRSEKPDAVAVAIDKEIMIYNRDGALICKAPFLCDGVHYRRASVTSVNDGNRYFILYQPETVGTRKKPFILFEYGREGQLLAKRYLRTPANRTYKYFSYALTELANMVKPLGLVFGEAILYKCGSLIGNRWASQRWEEYKDFYELHPENIYASILIGLLCWVVAFRYTRVYQFTQKESILWWIFIFLAGISGLLTFALLHPWPLREKCALCGKKRLVTLDHCEHCGAEWLPVPQNGTEIISTESDSVLMNERT